jgi:hypothetical protein
MIVAVIAVRMMKMPIDQVVYMIPVGNGFVATSGSVHMALIVCATTVLGCALIGIGR